MTLDLDAIQARADAATPGPWEAIGTSVSTYEDLADDDEAFYGIVQGRVVHGYDAEFIAHARTDVPALIAEVRRLRDELAQAEMRADAAEYDAIEADAR